MNLSENDISYWEYKMLFDSIDFLVVGAGIVGLSAAYHLKEKHPNSKVIVLDKGPLPYAASSKNAGFACFGSPSEILSDLRTMKSSQVWTTVEKRYLGLKALESWLGAEAIDLQTHGSWDLIDSKSKTAEIRTHLNELNRELKTISGETLVYFEDAKSLHRFGFQKIYSAFHNRLEGQLDTAKLNLAMNQKMAEKDILILRGIEMQSFESETHNVRIQSSIGEIRCTNLIICTNGFSKPILPHLDVEPARAQVLITQPIENLIIKGTFHFDEGYYYFRNIDNRILIGGGRNQNFEQENTSILQTTEDIQQSIEQLLKTVVLPNTPFQIDRRWAGIMGVGRDKSPIIQRLHPNVTVGIRMGGMGVAIGTLVGQELAEMHS
ncbi:MAG: FAD-binding oxidoreductase [Crocinitomicaceae bacterium]